MSLPSAPDQSASPDVGESSPSRRVAIVTGASRGIGAGVAEAFSRAGYAVVATARTVTASDRWEYLTVSGDITAAETAERVVEQAIGRFGRIDTLINNAGVFVGKPFTDYTVDDYDAATAVNLTGFFHITQRVVRQMLTQGTGHIVNVSTSLAEHAESKAPAALAALTKGGLTAVTRSLAIEFASRGIRGQRSLPRRHQESQLRSEELRGSGRASSARKSR